MAIEIKYSAYPFALDGTDQLPITSDNITEVNAEVVNRQRSAIVAIEGELGIDPSGVYTTVRARLDALESLIGSIEGGGGSGTITVLDEGIQIDDSASSINFVGDIIAATSDGSGNITVTIDGYAGASSQVQETISVTTPGQIAFTISQNPADASAVEMFVNGIKQQYGVDYIVSGTSVTYLASGTYPLDTPDVVEFWYLVTGVILPGGGSDIVVQDEGSTIEAAATLFNFRGLAVTASSGGAGIINVDINTSTIVQEQETVAVTSNGQTEFTISQEALDNTAVEMFVNGIKQQYGADYTVTGTTVTYTGSVLLITSDDVEFWYVVDGYSSGTDVQSWGETLAIANTSNGINLNLTGGSALTSSDGYVLVDDDLYVTGKLTVDGLIDPTGLVLKQQASSPNVNNIDEGSVWVKDDKYLVFTDQDNNDHLIINEDNIASFSKKYTVGPVWTGAEFQTIQAAVDQAVADGFSTVYGGVAFYVYPGFYNETVTIPATLVNWAIIGTVKGNIYVNNFIITMPESGQWMFRNMSWTALTVNQPVGNGATSFAECNNCAAYGAVNITAPDISISWTNCSWTHGSTYTFNGKNSDIYGGTIVGSSGGAVVANMTPTSRASIIGCQRIYGRVEFNGARLNFYNNHIEYDGSPALTDNTSISSFIQGNVFAHNAGPAGAAVVKTGAGNLHDGGNTFTEGQTYPWFDVQAGTRSDLAESDIQLRNVLEVSGSPTLTPAQVGGQRKTTVVKTDGGGTVTLPPIDEVEPGCTLILKDTSGSATSSPWVIVGQSGETIDGEASYTIDLNYDSVELQADTTNSVWIIISIENKVFETLLVNGDGYFTGSVNIDGKLTVDGLIDPTGLVLTEQASSPYSPASAGGTEGLIWVRDDGYFVFTNQNDTEFVLGEGGLQVTGTSLTAPTDPADDGLVAIASGGDLTYSLIANQNISSSANISVSKIESGAPDSVLQTIGGVPTWAALNYDSDQIDNVSTISGSSVSDALEQLNSLIVGGGSGTVTGPNTTTDNAIARWSGTDGYIIQNSGIIIDDSDNVTGVNNLTIGGNIIITGTVDGRTISSDGSTLDNHIGDSSIHFTLQDIGLDGYALDADLLSAPVNPGDDNKVAIASGGDLTYGLIVNNNVSSGADIDVSKLAAGDDGYVITTVSGTPTWERLYTALSSDGYSSLITISSGAITVDDHGHYLIGPESGDNDVLTTINGGIDGQVIVLYVDSGKTIVFDNLADNIVAERSSDIVLYSHSSAALSSIVLQLRNGYWRKLSYSDASQQRTVDGYDTLELSDAAHINGIKVDSATDIDLDIPNDSSVTIPDDTSIPVTNIGAGIVTIQASSGVTLNGVLAGSVQLAQYAGCVLWKQSTNVWLVIGGVS